MLVTTLISVGPLLLLGAGAVAAVMLFLSLRREAMEMRRRMAMLERTANEAFAVLHSRMEDIDDRLRQAEERSVASAPAHSGLNSGNRAQALRMLRRGVDARAIAASLNLPRPEIELLIRVQRLSAASEGATSETAGG